MYVEVHLVLCARRRADAAVVFGRALLAGTHSLDRPTDGEHARALDLVDRYGQSGLDLVDAIVMAMAATRGGLILTWDFRHFRAAVPARRRHWPLLVQEHEVPSPWRSASRVLSRRVAALPYVLPFTPARPTAR